MSSAELPVRARDSTKLTPSGHNKLLRLRAGSDGLHYVSIPRSTAVCCIAKICTA
ncbi:hypothetical protein C8R44DRAFT_758672 [Mycena epipterygia]|nr:hypothetical protein C8R44DRAFT_758672 [Mycena epipterygia]